MPYSTKWKSDVCYKACQCTDLKDCEDALRSLRDYADNLSKQSKKPPRGYYQRLFSIEKKYKKLFTAPFFSRA